MCHGLNVYIDKMKFISILFFSLQLFDEIRLKSVPHTLARSLTYRDTNANQNDIKQRSNYTIRFFEDGTNLFFCFFGGSVCWVWCVCSFFFHCKRKHSTIFVSICHFFLGWSVRTYPSHFNGHCSVSLRLVIDDRDPIAKLTDGDDDDDGNDEDYRVKIWPVLFNEKKKWKRKEKQRKKRLSDEHRHLIEIEVKKNQQKLIDFHFEFYMLMNECTTRACKIVEISFISPRQKSRIRFFVSSLVLLLSHSRK